ncbi:unnamed protein product, partial [Cyprideis torosa]
MVVQGIVVDSKCFESCILHCCTSEKEEVTGILVGELWKGSDSVVHVIAPCFLPRSVRSSDRVEVDPTVLVTGAQFAEEVCAHC